MFTSVINANVNFQTGSAFTSFSIVVSTASVEGILPDDEQKISFYSFAVRMCPLAFKPDGARFFSTSGRCNNELKSKKLPEDYIDGFVGKLTC
jgi:hypothetical protein